MKHLSRMLLLAGAAAVVVALVVGLHQSPSTGKKDHTVSLADQQRALAGAPSALAGLHVQAGELLSGGRTTFARRLADLRGHPVVVNKWASWCGPCTSEFPAFEHANTAMGKQVAFLGVNANDNDADARRFLRAHPVAYPSYEDGKGHIARTVSHSTFFPITAFYDASGHQQYVHQGPYTSASALEADIRRYAMS